MALDLTSSYYSLVVLASTTLGLSTYIHNHYIAAFREHQRRCKDGWKTRVEANAGFNFSEDAKSKIDKVEAQTPTQILKPVAFLVSALPYSALGQFANLGAKYWGDQEWLTSALVYSLLLWYLMVFGATLFILIKLNKLRSSVDEIKDSVDSVLTVADAECIGFANNHKKPQPQTKPIATPVLASPRIRQY